MAISEVKCGKCDKRYSALRGRCPYCGARRGSKGKFAGDPANMRGQMIIGVIILVALLAAVITLLIISVNSEPKEEPIPTASAPVIPDDGNVDSVIDDPIEISPTPEETFVPPEPSVQSVVIMFNGAEKTDITEKVGTTLTFKVKIVPEDIGIVPVWESSDAAVFDAVAVDAEGLSAKVTMLSKGNATLKVTVGDVTAECIVRVK